MNLHGAVRGLIRAVNPEVSLIIQVSTGYATSPDGTPVPSYASSILHYGQVQPLSQHDLRQVESLNLQGTQRAIYMNGNVDGIVRLNMKGGDLITVTQGPNSGLYLVNLVDEAWVDWCKCIVTLQNVPLPYVPPSPPPPPPVSSPDSQPLGMP